MSRLAVVKIEMLHSLGTHGGLRLEDNPAPLERMKNPAPGFIKPNSDMMNCAVFGYANRREVNRAFNAFPFGGLRLGGLHDPGQAQGSQAFKGGKQEAAPGGKDKAEQAPTIESIRPGRAGNPRLANEGRAKAYIFGNHIGGKRSESKISVGNFKLMKSTGTARPETWASDTVTD